MDGEDLSMYDTVGAVPAGEERDTEDRETLEKLEWELASDTGRLTGELFLTRAEKSMVIRHERQNSRFDSCRPPFCCVIPLSCPHFTPCQSE